MAAKLYLTSKFKELREAGNMTQQDFVELMAVYLDKPVSLSLVQKMEQGQRPISADLLLEFANYFKVTPKELCERR